MKIGIAGGSFDPIHYGHLILADQLINEAGLDKVIFVPNYISPNPSHEMKASAEDRFNMTRLAVQNHPKFEVSDLEIKANKLCYMDEDMKKLKELYPDDELYLVLGQDTFMRIKQWHNYESLLTENKFLIGKRPGQSTKELFGFFKELFQVFRGLSIEFYDIPEMDVSSYTIQNKIRVGKTVKYLLPDECIDYINTHNLYDSLLPRMKAFVQSNVKPHRYEHTKGVVDAARKLAIRYDADPKKAEIAAWFHDAFRDAGNLEHGPLAAEKIREMFGIDDPEIIAAIRNHTTGHPGMSKLEKIIYVADSLETNRDFEGVEALRKIMYVDLDECLYAIMVRTKAYVESLGKEFSPISDLAIAELKEKLKK